MEGGGLTRSLPHSDAANDGNTSGGLRVERLEDLGRGVMKPSLTRAVVLVSLVTAACAGPGAAGPPPSTGQTPAAPESPAKARESLRAAEAALAEALVRQGGAEGLTAFAAGDAVLLLPFRYVLRGAEAIRSGLADEPVMKAGVQSAEALVWNVSADGRMGYALGHIQLRPAESSTPGVSTVPGTSGAARAAGLAAGPASPTAPGPSGGAREAGTAAGPSSPAAPSPTGSTREAGTAAGPSSSTAPGPLGGARAAGSALGPSSSAAPSTREPTQRYVRYLAVWTRLPESPWRLAAITLGRPTGPLQVPPTYSVVPADARAARPTAPSDVLAEAFAADSAFSDQSTREGMGIAFGAWAAPDGVTPNGPTGNFGHDAIVRGYAAQTRDKVDLRWEPRFGGAAGSGDLAWTVGRAVAVAPGPDGQSSTHYTKYLSVWRRQPDGQWRYVADAGNGNPGPGGP
jgi:ketosteroid isomerase-like protein